jgi:hypothetical protein
MSLFLADIGTEVGLKVRIWISLQQTRKVNLQELGAQFYGGQELLIEACHVLLILR